MSKMTDPLKLFYDETNDYEICIDEVGRGCLFGRAYIAMVILPKDGSFETKDIKDSKKFSSKKKIREVSDKIKQSALAWHIEYIESDVIDELNILQAVMRGMHACIKMALEKIQLLSDEHYENKTFPKIMAVVDGNYFTPYRYFNSKTETIMELPAVTIEQGDAKYVGIAAASILAKVARDSYILEICEKDASLKDNYGLDTNMGYGTKRHLDGIRQHGIVTGHRKTFGICKGL
jgi:ribonuclease HII